MNTTLLVLASAIFLIAFWDYNKGVFTGGTMPAFTSWALFSLITLVNSATYLDFTAEWQNVMVLATDFVVCVGTTAVILAHNKGRVTVDETDKKIALISLIAVFIWAALNAAEEGNLINQVAYILAFIPNYRNAWKNPVGEPTRPWFWWTVAFVLNIAALAISSDAKPIDYVSPVVCLVCHIAMTALSLRRPARLPA